MFEKKNQIDVSFWERIYNENKNIFIEADYVFDRYKVDYCIAVVRIHNRISNCAFDILSIIRANDRFIRVKEDIYVILFTYANYNQACSAVYNLERNLLQQCGINLSEIFKCSILQKTDNQNSLELLLQVARKLFLYDLKEDIIII